MISFQIDTYSSNKRISHIESSFLRANTNSNRSSRMESRHPNRCISSRDPRGPILAERHRRALQINSRDSGNHNSLQSNATQTNVERRIVPGDHLSGMGNKGTSNHGALLPIQQAMVNEAIKSLGGNESLRPLLCELIRASLALQIAMGGRGHVHLFLPCEFNNSSSGNNDKKLLPIVSALFHSALMANSLGSTIAGNAIRDAFHIAQKVVNGRFAMPHQVSSHTSVTNIELPKWFPYSDLHNPTTPLQTAVNINCDSSIMQKLEGASPRALNKIYGQLFSGLWNKGRDKKLVSGSIVYAKMTPPWMRCPVVFVHGGNGNSSTPFNGCKLPTKSEVRDPGNQNLVRAIFTTVLQKEPFIAPILKCLLRQIGIEIPERDYSSSTIDLIPRNNITFAHDEQTSLPADIEVDNSHSAPRIAPMDIEPTTDNIPGTAIIPQSFSNAKSIGSDVAPSFPPTQSRNNSSAQNVVRTIQNVSRGNVPMTGSQFFAAHYPGTTRPQPGSIDSSKRLL